MDKDEILMILPRLQIHSEYGIIPNIRLPENLLDLVPRFYQNNGRETIENYVSDLIKTIKGTPQDFDIKLIWDAELGLRNIGIGSGGLDLNLNGWPSFQLHNIGQGKALISSAIGSEYLWELLRHSD